MNKLKTLIIKDWQINKKTFLMPFWITAGFYALILLSVLVAYFKGDFQISYDFLQDIETGPPVPILNFMINMAIMGLPGFMSLIFTIMLTQNALNEDLRRNFELFHRSQPVSIWQRSLSKYITGIGGFWIVLFLIGIFNFIVVNSFVAIVGQFHFKTAISGMMLAQLGYMKFMLIIGSLAFFCSAIFKDKAFFKGLSVLLAIHVLFLIVNVWFGWKLPMPFTYLIDLLKDNSVTNFQGNDFFFGTDSTQYFEISELIKEKWSSLIFSWKSLLQIAVSGSLFAISTFIYKNKEVK